MKDHRDIQPDEVAAFRRETNADWDDLPDEYVVKSFAFSWWLFAYRVRKLARQFRFERRPR